MDHHCPWVDNCIGFYNKKFFIQLLCYFFLASLIFCVTYIPYSYNIFINMFERYTVGVYTFHYKNCIIVLNNMILLGFTFVDFNFLKFHLKLIASNLTTIETLDNELSQNKKYDLGFISNFKQVFGENKLLWFIPINSPIGYPNGDGLTWQTKEDLISLENLGENKENNNIDNENTLENINTIQRNNSQNISVSTYIGAAPTKSSSVNDFQINAQKYNGNYSKYNIVKRNSSNYYSNSTGYESNSNNSKNNSNNII